MVKEYEREYIKVSDKGITLHVVKAGPEDGRMVVLLHGFPEFWYGWRAQIDALAEAGYRVIVPDQRGYNLSDKPNGVEHYHLDLLAGDVVGLIQSQGRESALVVGHDWGAVVAWWVAMRHPERVERLGILNVPHPTVAARKFEEDPAQMLKSWYILYFQIPFLPEAISSFNNYDVVAELLKNTSNPGSFTEADLNLYRAAWSQPGAFTSMLNWYRALVQLRPEMPEGDAAKLKMPVLIQWGKNDVALEAGGASESLEFCEDGRLIMYEDATHWVQHDKPEHVNNELLAFLAEE